MTHLEQAGTSADPRVGVIIVVGPRGVLSKPAGKVTVAGAGYRSRNDILDMSRMALQQNFDGQSRG